jgi:hypothetical protein
MTVFSSPNELPHLSIHPKGLSQIYSIHPNGTTSDMVFMPLMYIVLHTVFIQQEIPHPEYSFLVFFMGRTPLHSYCQWDMRTHDWRRPESRSRHRDKRLRIVQFQPWQLVLGHQRCSNRSQLRRLDSWETGKSCKCC